MRAVVIYESMYGNTHAIADAIGRGLAPGNDVTVVPVAEATRDLLDEADLVVAGGPTHVHGMSGARSRQAAVEAAHKDGSGLTLEPHAQEPGLRELLGTVGHIHGVSAAFDTRLDGPAMLTGHASKAIAKLLDRHGLTEIAPAQSFLVTKDNQLRPGEEDRAEQWGRELAAKLPAAIAFL
jgi:flavodoxin-like protein